MRSILALVMLCVLALPAPAAPSKTLEDGTSSAETQKVAVLPWIYLKGTPGAQKTAREFLSAVLVKARLEEIPEARTLKMWENGLGNGENSGRKEMPRPAQLLKLGQKLGADWVITGRAAWHTRSIWVGLGPKTKSDCTVDMLIVDVRKSELALDAKAVRMDSTAKEDALKAAGTVLLTPLFTVVSGGPKTPHEQRAVQLAVAKAMQPWLATRVESSRKITPDR